MSTGKNFQRWGGVLGGLIGGCMVMTAQAATTTFTVDALTAGVEDANVGDGACATVASECTLYAALQEANALPAPLDPTDVIRIEFADGLEGDIIHNGSTPRMFDQTLGSTAINDYLGVGAFLHVNAAQPLTIDFDNRVGSVQHSDNEYAMLYIASNDVVVENFRNADKPEGTGSYAAQAGITGAGTAIVIDAQRVTIRNGYSSDTGTISQESCISLLDGSADISIEDFYCRGSALFGIYFDERGTYSNINLLRYETQDNRAFGDIWVEFGSADDKTEINGFTVTDSEFRTDSSNGLNYTIGLRQDSVINDLVITNSRFLGTDVLGIGIYPSAQTNGLIVQDSTITGTRQIVRDDGRTLQTGFVFRNNILTDVGSDMVWLNSPHNDAVIEGNQFIDGAGEGNIAGIHINADAFGSNNVIRDNIFDQRGNGESNRMAIWFSANPGEDVSTGWSIDNNDVQGILGGSAPILIQNNGDTLAAGNTFGEGTRGAAIDDNSIENADGFFVDNEDLGTNGSIQTWRPTGAVYTGATIRVSVAPVDPPQTFLNAPTNPVSIDVYHTATDKAETYLGRIPGTHSSETVFEFTSTLEGGAVRAQITDADGRSSQYSGAVISEMGVDSGADDDMDGLPNGAECTINLLGIPLICPDNDGDGDPDYLDADDDNDGIPTATECPDGSPCVDTDGDGTPNNLDLDSDDDGISDAEECPQLECRDTDGDGMANYIDTDSDDDGLDDAVECPDGVPCTDADGNAVEDYLEQPAPLVARATGGAAGPWLLLGLSLFGLRRRRRALVGLLALGALAGAGQAAAADNDWMSRFYAGAQVGGLFTDFDEDELTRALQGAGYTVDEVDSDSEGLGYGLWLGYALTRSWALELGYITGADEEVVYSGSAGGDLEAAMDVAAPHLRGYGDSYLLRARYHHELSQYWFVSPRIGVGYTQTRESLTRGDNAAHLNEDDFSWTLGAGIHRVLSANWSAGLSLDYVQSSSDSAYGLVSAVLEWRFPQALPRRDADAPGSAPVQVVPPVASVPQEQPSSWQPAAKPEPVPASPPGLDSLVLHDVTFETGGAQLTAQARSVLDGILPALKGVLQASSVAIEVAGHTDSTGSAALNQRLSQARAQAVRDYLVRNGVASSRLSARGYGASEPEASNETAEGRARNRRVELVEAN